MTLGQLLYEAQPQAMSPCVLGLGSDRFVGSLELIICPNIYICFIFLLQFRHIRQGDLTVVKTLQPFIVSLLPLGCSGIGLYWGLGRF